jgi:hypothetical protein
VAAREVGQDGVGLAVAVDHLGGLERAAEQKRVADHLRLAT